MSFHRFHDSLSSKALRAFAVLTITAAGVAAANAQAAQPDSSRPFPVPQASGQLFSSSSDQSSSSDGGVQDGRQAPDTVASLNPASGVNFANYMQYGGGQRKRYGKPTYRGNHTTADGTPKYTFEVGGGFTQPTGNTWHYLTPSYAIGFGGGRNFNRKIGVLLQIDYDHFGFSGQTLNSESGIYNADPNPNNSGFDGTSHIWSASLNPVYTIVSGGSGGFGLYAVAGVGFYHKLANFTTPQQSFYYDPYYGAVPTTVNTTIAHYVSNAPGFSGGFGVTYKISRFANERFFAEVRYVFVDNSQRQGYVYSASANNGTGGAVPNGPNPQPYNFYPANSNHTDYVPVKFGIRF